MSADEPLFGVVTSASGETLSVCWDGARSSQPIPWSWDGNVGVRVVAEDLEPRTWRPLLTGGVPMLRKLAGHVLARADVQEVWRAYDMRRRNVMGFAELRNLLEDLREVQFLDREVPDDLVVKMALRIKRESLSLVFRKFDPDGSGFIPFSALPSIVQYAASLTMPPMTDDDVAHALAAARRIPGVDARGRLSKDQFVDWWLHHTQSCGDPDILPDMPPISWTDFRIYYQDRALYTGSATPLLSAPSLSLSFSKL